MAVLKYWGKSDEDAVIPLHDSISATLHLDCMASSIIIKASDQFTSNQMTLNGKEVDMTSNARLRSVLEQCRSLAGPCPDQIGGDWSRVRLHLQCSNDFPTAAGLASSASGYACLTAALSHLYQCHEQYPGHITAIARSGSGSACRSMYGGFVQWTRTSPSVAMSIVPESYWPELRVLILVVDAAAKAVGSTVGMRRSTATSSLLRYRTETVVPERIEAFRRAIALRDFGSFAELTMRDSNQFHAICADTYPPIFYLNSTSHSIIDAVHRFNDAGSVRAAYTFDAGPNACIFTRESDLSDLAVYLLERFRPESIALDGFIRDPLQLLSIPAAMTNNDMFINGSRVQQMIVTKVGPGPIIS